MTTPQYSTMSMSAPPLASAVPRYTTSPSVSARKKRVPVPIDSRLVAASNQAWHASGADEPGTSEYGAVVALESYFHAKPFTYDQTPDYSGGPVLAEFMMHSHHGYCQMFAGSMALVLRLHGIPARVVEYFGPPERRPADLLVEPHPAPR